jgi:hypothetical protein
LRVFGQYHFEIIRDGKVIDSFDEKNIVVDEGINHILNSVFHGDPQVTTWYVGIFEGNYTPVAGNTAATFPASATECVAYTEAARQEFIEAASTAKSVTNSASKAAFSINATKTVYGCFLVSSSGKSSTLGTLMSAVRFSSAKALTSGDVLTVSYTINMASS